MPHCSFKNCPNFVSQAINRDDISFFHFPRNLLQSERWRVITARQRCEESFTPTPASVICCEHFKHSDIYLTSTGRKRLLKTAVPQTERRYHHVKNGTVFYKKPQRKSFVLTKVPRARIALQHNLGLGGAAVVTMYRKGFGSANANNVAAISTNPEQFKVYKYMKILEEAMQTDEEGLIEKVRGVYGFRVRGGPGGADGYWVINAREGRGSVSYNGSDKPDVTFTVSDDDVSDLIAGKLNPQKAFFQGKIKIQGNMGLAMKLTDLQRSAAGRIDAIRSKL